MSAIASSHPLMLRLLSASVAAANRAGEIVRDVLKSGSLGVVMKGRDDPQTEADRRAQRCIVASLSSQFPNITIVGEETLPPSQDDQTLVMSGDSAEVLQEACPPQYAGVEERQVVVWVDPLDGTKEFTLAQALWIACEVLGLGTTLHLLETVLPPAGYVEDVTVLVGIAVDGQPVGGAIHQPFFGSTSNSGAELGRTIWGLTGLGVRGLPPRPLFSGGLRVAMTRSHSTELVERTIDALNPQEIIRVGGCGHKVLLLLEGRADAYVFASPGTKKWDTCVGDALVRQLGGQVTNIHGQPLTYEADPANHHNKQGLVMTFGPPGTHEDVVGKIPDDVKRELPARL